MLICDICGEEDSVNLHDSDNGTITTITVNFNEESAPKLFDPVWWEFEICEACFSKLLIKKVRDALEDLCPKREFRRFDDEID